MAFEIATLVLGILLMVLSFKKLQQTRVYLIFTVALVAVFGISIYKTSFLWYDAPMFVLVVLAVMGLVKEPEKPRLRMVVLAACVVIYGGCLAVFPRQALPEATGPENVGTTVFTVTDENRSEDYNKDVAHRTIKLQAWYPLDSTENLKKAPWLYDGIDVARGLARDSSLPGFLLDQMAFIPSNSYEGGALPKGKNQYPVVILSHGWRSARNLYQDTAENLASRGFVVFAIDHTYGSVATDLEKQGLRKINYDALPKLDDPTFWDKANKLVSTYAGDVKTSLSYIEELNKNSDLFNNRLDLDNVGLLGHSTGGGGDVDFALTHPKIKAVVGMDAWVEPISKKDLEKGLDVPALFLRSGQWEDGSNNKNLAALEKYSEVKPLYYQVKDTTHYDFAMVYMYTPLIKTLGFSGKIPKDEMTKLERRTVTDFFEETLKEGKTKDFQIEENKYLKAVDINK